MNLENEDTFQVLFNDLGQYSLFPIELPVPGGWHAADFAGTEDECVAFVDKTWIPASPEVDGKRP